MKTNFYSLVLNLTAHAATPDQIVDGLEDVEDISRLKAYLDISEEDLMASESDLDRLLDEKVRGIISTYILPAQAKRLLDIAEAIDPQTGSIHTIHEILNVARFAFSFQAMVGGAPILMERLIPALKALRITPVYSLSTRVIQDEIQPDGSTLKLSVHRHIRFRAARKP